MLHMYQGDGKGKTTAAFGLVLRELGYHRKVLIIQFLKNGTSGEMKALKEHPNVKQYANEECDTFYFQMKEQEKVQYAQTQCALWNHFVEEYGAYDCIVLDELLDVIHLQIVKDQDVIDVLKTISKDIEIVITGRNPSIELQSICDYHSEMVAHQHPYQKGIAARKGVEF